MTTKKESKKEEKKKEVKFNLDEALSNVNPYLLPGFLEYIKDVKVTSQKQFDKYHNDYKELK